MLNFHLEVAAAKAAVSRKPVPATGSVGKHVPSKPSSSRSFTSAFPHDDDEGKTKSVGGAPLIAKAIKIPQFTLGTIQWDTKEKEDSLVDEQTTNIRNQVLNTVNSCLARQNAPSTISSYEAILNKEVGYAQDKMNTILLPLVTEEKFLALFGFLKLNNPDLKWSRVQALKSALKKWHSRNALECVFDKWTPIMQALWTGLSRSAKHSVRGKDPIEFKLVMNYFSITSDDVNPATIRLRAMVSVGFFGVRRCAEILNFTMADVKLGENSDYHLLVRCQKNDQEGIGMHCVIPSVESLGSKSPSAVLAKWISCRGNFAKSIEHSEPLFCTVAGTTTKIGSLVSADSFRKALCSNFPGNTATHSLRKGGARFYAASQAPEQATRDQGGWRTTETMREIYTALTPSEVKAALHRAANAAGDCFALHELSELLQPLALTGESADIKTAKRFVQLVDEVIGKVSMKNLVECKAGIHLKRLLSHPNEEVRSAAISAYGHLRSAWASYKVESRKG
jgi:hypothetical protein